MQKLTSKDEEVYVFKKFLSKKECSKYFKMIHDIGHQPFNLPWPDRTKDITKDPIVNKVTKFINKKFNLNLMVDQAEIQNHHVNSSSDLHVHDHLGRENIEYNSLIYLNDDFDQGYFITKNGIKIKPEKGMLTFFNGQKIYHGVEKVLKKDRKTLIFWWKKNAI
jgi:hypothetical protein